MVINGAIQKRFDELAIQEVGLNVSNGMRFVDSHGWGNWSSSALNLLQITFGKESAHYNSLKRLAEADTRDYYDNYREALGVFLGAKVDYEKGCYVSLDRLVSGEVFGDFIAAAKKALAEGNKDVAAVLACAALEDALKRLATTNGISPDGKDMSEVIAALKSKGLVGGAQKSILETMPKTRNSAMHADWSKISTVEVGGVIGFTEQFLLQHFS